MDSQPDTCLTLTDLVKASMSVRLQEEYRKVVDQEVRAVIKLKLAYLIFIVQKFRNLREGEPLKYKEEYRYALK